MRRPQPTSTREPTIALINIVFLMLIFFMVAGTLAPPLDADLMLVDTRDLDASAPPDALVAHPDGRLSYRGKPVASAADYLAAGNAASGDSTAQTVRILPDRNLAASRLVALARDLRIAGAGRVLVVTEQGLP
jgi:biopolymer transport protein ExbD